MSRGPALRALVTERLSAAAEDIFALFERTIAEYEEELRRSEEENRRKQRKLRLLDAVLNPRVLLFRAGAPGDPAPSQKVTQTAGIKEEREEEQLPVFASESGAVRVKREEPTLLQKPRTEHRGEAHAEDASSETHFHAEGHTEDSSDTDDDDDWEPPLGCLEAPMEMETEDDEDHHSQVQTRNGGTAAQNTGDLLADPIAPVDSSCQHYVCLGCKGQRMQLRPSCSWCKDYSRFEQNRQLSLLVLCYRRLCAYVAQSTLAPHIAEAAVDCPDLQAVLSEGLEGLEEGLGEGLEDTTGTEEEEREDSQEEAPSLQQAPEDPSLAVNGLHDCNGLPTAVTMETGGGAGLCDIIEELRPGAGPLLLSVEEVLRTLDPPSVNGQALLQSEPASQPSPAPCPQLYVQSERSAVLAPFRCHRKRSRSESDSEKLMPVSLSALRGSQLNPSPKQEPHFTAICPLPALATVPNGGPPKVGKTLLLPNKALKKTLEHHGVPKKACAKARQQGAPKPRPQPRISPHTQPLSHPPSPSKPSYKKPPEKKGCKCGRATQNPSVLTCRGQRCPCYSNRKACLDCICRGCQNSFMANGEKKLEAFAVPEKALEQTRLTLGINLSSITALRNPATAAPGNALIAAATGSPVTASFLSSGAGHDGRAYDDSLELRFDC